MCGIAGLAQTHELGDATIPKRMVRVLAHRGPDDEGVWTEGGAGLASRRLAILDLSEAGHQPMVSADGRYVLAFNGEVFNYLELREELPGKFTTQTDTEVVLRALETWGVDALARFNGQFAIAYWDRRERKLLLARDRFGEKPLYYAVDAEGAIRFGSEVKALAAGGVPIHADTSIWLTYLAGGVYDHGEATFFDGVRNLLPGTALTWQDGAIEVSRYYDLAAAAASPDERSDDAVGGELLGLLEDAVRLRFRADVPVGLCLSGGLDSSVLFALAHRLHGSDARIRVYHYATGDEQYDETPWVRRLLEGTNYPLHVATLRPEVVPKLADDAAYHQEAPYGGLPTLAQIQMYEAARRDGTTVLLGGDGLDEQWAGYDYYRRAVDDPSAPLPTTGPVQASATASTARGSLRRDIAIPVLQPEGPPLRTALQRWRHRDITQVKVPRALRFVDRSSSMHSTELRSAFMDHRLMDLAMRQPDARLVRGGTQKFILRRVAEKLMPPTIALAPKRPVQTPQREWFRGPLRDWVEAAITSDAFRETGWFDERAVHEQWQAFLTGRLDNSFFAWQWISAAAAGRVRDRLAALEPA